MKVIEGLVQRTEEWFSFKNGKISGSKADQYSRPRLILKEELMNYAKSKGYEFKPSLTINNIRGLMTQDELNELDYTVQLNDSICKLIAEEIAKPIDPNDYLDRLGNRPFSMMARGEILEDEAREKLSKKLNKNVLPGRVWQADFNERIIVSPDGEIINKKGIIVEAVEIKCLDSWKVVKAFYEKRPPIEYKYQIVQYFLVNEKLKKLYFVIYSDCFAAAPDLELQIFEINRSDFEQEIMQARYMQEATLEIVAREVEKLTF